MPAKRLAMRTRAFVPPRSTLKTMPSSLDLTPYLKVANQVADVASSVTLRHFRTGLNVETKTDESPVTVADRQAEAKMRELIRSSLPKHGVYGEEFGYDEGDESEFLWVLDPIDGTKSFITGKPVFGTLIAVLYRGKPVIGIIDQPVLKERWVGAQGMSTTLNGKQIATRKCAQLSDAYLYATSPMMFSGRSAEAFDRLSRSVRIPLYGCDCYAYGLLSAGHCDVVAEADMKPYDYMALVPIVEGAGGVMTDWSGNALMIREDGSLDGLPREVIAAGDTASHAQALRALDWS